MCRSWAAFQEQAGDATKVLTCFKFRFPRRPLVRCVDGGWSLHLRADQLLKNICAAQHAGFEAKFLEVRPK